MNTLTSTPQASGHGSTTSYVVGLVLSVLLTVVPFGMVMHGGFAPGVTLATVVTMAVLQVLVQLLMFMHLDGKAQGGWNLLTLVFALTVVGMLLAGSLWIMYHLMVNLM